MALDPSSLAKPGTAHGVTGAFDSLSLRHARGWAIADGSDTLEVELLRGGRVIATTRTGLPRRDIARRLGRANAGFRIALPRYVAPSDDLSVRVAGQATVLPRQAGFITAAPVPGTGDPGSPLSAYGHVDSVDGVRVRGWAVRPGSDEPPLVLFHAGAKLVGLARAGDPRPDVEADGAGPLHSGFDTLLRLPPATTGSILVTASIGDGGVSLDRGRFEIAVILSIAPAANAMTPALALLDDGRFGIGAGRVPVLHDAGERGATVAFGVTTLGHVARHRLDSGGDAADLVAPLLLLAAFAGERDDSIATDDGGTVAPLRDAAAFPCWRFAPGRRPVAIHDASFPTTHDLRLRCRVENDPAAPSDAARLIAYQLSVSGIRLIPSGRIDLPATLDSVDVELAIRLTDPFRPILIAVLDRNDELLALDLLPFPSLCRGGWHEAEARGAAGSSDMAAATAALSARLAERYWYRTGNGPRIALDCIGSTATEPGVATSLASWLRHFAATLGIVPTPPGTEAPFVEALPPMDPADADLLLPADAIPSIAALVAPPRAGGFVSASHAVIDIERPADAWLVDLPPIGDWLRALHTPTAACWCPWARVSTGEVPPFSAIRHVRRGATGRVTAWFPSSADTNLPRHRHGGSLTILLSGDARSETSLLALEAIQQQSIAADCDLLFVDTHGRGMPPRIDGMFGGRVRMLSAPDAGTILAQIATGTIAAGDVVAWCGDGVILHDPLTLEMLVAACSPTPVGWVGTPVVTDLSASSALTDAGATIAGVALAGGPRLDLAPWPHELLFVDAILPVAFPPGALAVVATEKLRAMTPGACDNPTAWFAAALRGGLVNLCITGTAVSLPDAPVAPIASTGPALSAIGDIEAMLRANAAVRRQSR